MALVQLDVDNERCKSTANRLLVACSALAYVSHVLAVPVLDFRCRVTSSDWELYGKQRSKCNVFHLVVGLLLWCFQSLCLVVVVFAVVAIVNISSHTVTHCCLLSLSLSQTLLSCDTLLSFILQHVKSFYHYFAVDHCYLLDYLQGL